MEKSPCGIVLLAKQSGQTSFSALGLLKRVFGTKKVGHAGTLDSFADGLLIAAVGQATRLSGDVALHDKEYEAIFEFGTQTDTLDPQGKAVAHSEIPSQSDFFSALNFFKGEIWQVPPEFSAVHIGGKRAYSLAAKGEKPKIPPRKVKINSIEPVEFSDKFAHVKVSCSKGTYIRSLARDVAEKCGSVAHLAALRRTRIGGFSLSDSCGKGLLPAFSIENLKNLQSHKIQMPCDAEILSALKEFSPDFARMCGFRIALLKKTFWADFSTGKPIRPQWLESPVSDGEFCAFCGQKFCGKIAFCNGRFSYRFVCPI